MKVGDRVRIVGSHPHRGSTGTVSSLDPPHMAKHIASLRGLICVALDDNCYSESGCYASRNELRPLRKDEDPYR